MMTCSCLCDWEFFNKGESIEFETQSLEKKLPHMEKGRQCGPRGTIKQARREGGTTMK